MSVPAGTKKIAAYGLHQTQIIRQKMVQDIIEYVKKEEYGKCSELLLIAVENGAVPLSEIWQPLVITIRQQNGAHLLDSILNSISAAEKSNPPFPASMERVFVELDRNNMTQAYNSLMAFSENLGSKLALAHGYRGTLVACMREVDIRRRHTEAFFDPSAFHVFSLSESVEFVLTKDDRDLVSMFNLDDARVHLEKALSLDPSLDMFRAIYAQVLVALDRVEDARLNLENYYQKCRDLHILK
ncbi:hypothetical protein IW150_002906 [Coemansia sp. RSA 2607]|nr:hypothetical protein IW150_002906 [Coemansia sp. RSA 2607]KAJ2394940.1 hypothetical protein GGI05_001816 [Coemansia sp. RSA 2603]